MYACVFVYVFCVSTCHITLDFFPRTAASPSSLCAYHMIYHTSQDSDVCRRRRRVHRTRKGKERKERGVNCCWMHVNSLKFDQGDGLGIFYFLFFIDDSEND
jgi:hypothetical protein